MSKENFISTTNLGLGSYPSIWAFGHPSAQPLMDAEVLVQEKVDGSQFSFGKVQGNLRTRSKGAAIWPEAPPKMFEKAVKEVQAIEDQLTPEWIYRGEYLSDPKHNALKYDRVPKKNIMLFDVNTGPHRYLPYEDLVREAERLGFEVVPRLYVGKLTGPDQFRGFLNSTSVLGGQKIEGVVVKPINYDLFGTDKKVLMGKFVSEDYKEVHAREWGKMNPSNGNIIQKIGENVGGPARWNKAIIHMREEGKIQDAPQDIGPLLKAINQDILKEETELVKDLLFKKFWGDIIRAATRGFPQWYKEQLLLKAFETGTVTNDTVDLALNLLQSTDVEDLPAWKRYRGEVDPGFHPIIEEE